MPAKNTPRTSKWMYLSLPGAVFIASLALAGQSAADSFGGRLMVNDPITKQECGDCHMAYPAALLSKTAWKEIMTDLPNHFGEDASLNEKTRQHIEDYLIQNTKWQSSSSSLRISEQRWFTHEHKREVSDRRFKEAKSWANCQACHKGADRGNFEDEEEHERWSFFGDDD